MSYMRQNKKRKQTLESAYGLEISLKNRHSILQLVEFRRSTENPVIDVNWHTINLTIPSGLKTAE